MQDLASFPILGIDYGYMNRSSCLTFIERNDKWITYGSVTNDIFKAPFKNEKCWRSLIGEQHINISFEGKSTHCEKTSSKCFW